MIPMKNHCEYLIEQAYEEESEETGETDWSYDDKISVKVSTLETILQFLRSQEAREPMQDVIFFVGHPTLDTIVYHVLCRDITLEAMRKDPNIHMMRMKVFDGDFEQDGGDRTLDEQETATREMLTKGDK